MREGPDKDTPRHHLQPRVCHKISYPAAALVVTCTVFFFSRTRIVSCNWMDHVRFQHERKTSALETRLDYCTSFTLWFETSPDPFPVRMFGLVGRLLLPLNMITTRSFDRRVWHGSGWHSSANKRGALQETKRRQNTHVRKCVYCWTCIHPLS